MWNFHLKCLLSVQVSSIPSLSCTPVVPETLERFWTAANPDLVWHLPPGLVKPLRSLTENHSNQWNGAHQMLVRMSTGCCCSSSVSWVFPGCLLWSQTVPAGAPFPVCWPRAGDTCIPELPTFQVPWHTAAWIVCTLVFFNQKFRLRGSFWFCLPLFSKYW